MAGGLSWFLPEPTTPEPADARKGFFLVHMASLSTSRCRRRLSPTTETAGLARREAVPPAAAGNAGAGEVPASVTPGWQLPRSTELLQTDASVEEGAALMATKTGQDGTKSLFSEFGLLWRGCEKP